MSGTEPSKQTDLKTVLIWCTVAAGGCVVLLLLSMVMSILDGFTDEGARVVLLSLVGLGVSLGVAAAAAGWRKESLRLLCGTAVALIVLCGAFLALFILSNTHETGFAWQMVSLVLSGYLLGLGLAHTALFLSLPTPTNFLRGLQVTVIGAAWCALGSNMLLMHADVWMFAQLLAITASIATLLTIVGTILVPILALSRAMRSQPKAETFESKQRITFTCPKCGAGMSEVGGSVRCAACGASMHLEIEEPRCGCGYVLYNLTGRQCPECGEEIAAELLPAHLREGLSPEAPTETEESAQTESADSAQPVPPPHPVD